MESRKTIRRRLKRQQSNALCKKGIALTTICASTMPMMPLTVLANDDTEETHRVHVVDNTEDQHDLQTEETVQSHPEEMPSDTVREDGQEELTVVDDQSSTEDTAVAESDITPEDFPQLVEEDPSQGEAQPAIVDEGQVLPYEDLTNARSANPQAFIQQVGPMAQQVAGANDLYASIMIAQAILESGWGQSLLTRQANNMFGIKGSYNGQFVEMKTLEDDGKGNLYEVVARFRKYPSLQESFADNAHVLRTTSFTPGVFFYSGAWRSNTNSYRDAAHWLQGRYATDTTYASKLINLIETYNLTQYDSGTSGGSNPGSNNTQETAINQQFRTTAALNIRRDASTSASITGTLANNATFQAVASKTGTSVNGNTTWYRINGRGWVSAAYVTSVNNNTNNQETAINQQFRTTAALNVRADASTSARITGSLARQATIQATASKTGTSVNGNNTWYRINNGWVSGAYLQSVSASNTSSKTHTVKSGDTLWQIAQTNGVSVNQLMSWNNLNSSMILVGQRLIVAR
ncbi:hypothetical protein A5886_000920 [Enterococcus sp. 8G7_MSG3316]|uniref:Peptidoglycan hydrolase n=1 Tax=Candidatus Enterococcus testudinis TaxID=1834191 RepID=A0A242A496_9ENTE|nr:glucosaminidase domain-containing protein [Enterococcus sp. 8G7_MSG3316]OTN75844.1 hypothetical protein A5886_000920 [Enterococcus sp. 8G7_MSG3316]